MSGERVWRKEVTASHIFVKSGNAVIAEVWDEADADQIVREHNAYQDAVAALEKIADYDAMPASQFLAKWGGFDTPPRMARAALQSIKEQGA